MKPYFERDGIVLYHGDCREILPQLEQVDHVITDPPYAEETHEGARTGSGDTILIDFPPLSEHEIRETFGILGNLTRRWVISFMDWRHVSAMERCPPCGLRFVRFGIWYKPNGMPQYSGDRPSTGWEAIAFMHAAGGRMTWQGGGRHGVFIQPKVNSEHPTGKPLGLTKELIELFTNPGETILDPFAGSGTTGVAAFQLSRKAILIELEEKWCEVTAKRLTGLTPPLPLVIPEHFEQPVLIPPPPVEEREKAGEG